MNISDKGIALIKSFEGLRLTSYDSPELDRSVRERARRCLARGEAALP